MIPTKVTALLILMFALALASGVVTGRAISRPPAPSADAACGSFLSQELQLSPRQREQMRPIWEAARDTAQSCARDAERVEREDRERLEVLLTDEQKARYQQYSEEDHRRIMDLDIKRKKAFHNAVELTEKILREDQKRAYERIISSEVGEELGPLNAN